MSRSELFLGVIAAATLVMALIQVGAIVAILRLVRMAQQTIADVHRDVRPLIEQATVVATKATAIADEASRTATIATIQAEDRSAAHRSGRPRRSNRGRRSAGHHHPRRAKAWRSWPRSRRCSAPCAVPTRAPSRPDGRRRRPPLYWLVFRRSGFRLRAGGAPRRTRRGPGGGGSCTHVCRRRTPCGVR